MEVKKDIDIAEKRVHRRLDVRMPLEYSPANQPHANVSSNVTINVSTGGLYFETADSHLQLGDELNINLAVPPGDTRFPPHAKISSTGRVVRVNEIKNLPNHDKVAFARFGIAAQFQKPLKLAL